METRIIDGAALASATRMELKPRVSRLSAIGRTPGLAVILVGEDPASQVYVRNKGIQTRVNGVVKQDANTRDMIFPVDVIIERDGQYPDFAVLLEQVRQARQTVRKARSKQKQGVHDVVGTV